MSKFKLRVGMWRCRDGGIACVWHIVPKWVETSWPLIGYTTEEGFLSWSEGGKVHELLGDSPCDLIEHLSDEIADPRTWQPPVTLREGVWEFDDGSRGVALPFVAEKDFVVLFINGKSRHLDMVYTKEGEPKLPTYPKAVRFIGPLPTGEEKQ